MKGRSTRITWADWIAAAAVLLSALLLLIPVLAHPAPGKVLVITTPEGSAEYPLSQDRELEIVSRGITLHIVISDGCAHVSESNCPDRVCVAGGSISRVGETVVCAPAGVRLTVKGGSADDDDFVAG